MAKKRQLPKGASPEDPEMLYWDKYNTPLTSKEQILFEKWIKEESARKGRDIIWDMGTYDMQGSWKSGDYLITDKDGHGSDRWKKPNHPKFSTESVYHGKDGNYAGVWKGDAFQPSKQLVDLYGVEGLQRYFSNEPNRPEYLDMSRFESGKNKPTPLFYKDGGMIQTTYNPSQYPTLDELCSGGRVRRPTRKDLGGVLDTVGNIGMAGAMATGPAAPFVLAGAGLAKLGAFFIKNKQRKDAKAEQERVQEEMAQVAEFQQDKTIFDDYDRRYNYAAQGGKVGAAEVETGETLLPGKVIGSDKMTIADMTKLISPEKRILLAMLQTEAADNKEMGVSYPAPTYKGKSHKEGGIEVDENGMPLKGGKLIPQDTTGRTNLSSGFSLPSGVEHFTDIYNDLAGRPSINTKGMKAKPVRTSRSKFPQGGPILGSAAIAPGISLLEYVQALEASNSVRLPKPNVATNPASYDKGFRLMPKSEAETMFDEGYERWLKSKEKANQKTGVRGMINKTKDKVKDVKDKVFGDGGPFTTDYRSSQNYISNAWDMGELATLDSLYGDASLVGSILSQRRTPSLSPMRSLDDVTNPRLTTVPTMTNKGMYQMDPQLGRFSTSLNHTPNYTVQGTPKTIQEIADSKYWSTQDADFQNKVDKLGQYYHILARDKQLGAGPVAGGTSTPSATIATNTGKGTSTPKWVNPLKGSKLTKPMQWLGETSEDYYKGEADRLINERTVGIDPMNFTEVPEKRGLQKSDIGDLGIDGGGPSVRKPGFRNFMGKVGSFVKANAGDIGRAGMYLFDYLNNQNILKNMPNVPRNVYEKGVDLQELSADPQIREIQRNQNAMNRALTQSGGNPQYAMQASRAGSLNAINQAQAGVNNANIDIRGREAMINSGIGARNAQSARNFALMQLERDLRKMGLEGENTTTMANNMVSIIENRQRANMWRDYFNRFGGAGEVIGGIG